MTPPTRLATYFHVHLVSDSTGETLNAMARAVCARFNNVLPIEHIYALVRSQKQLERALSEIADAPGVVLHTIVDQSLRAVLEEGCQKLDMPCIGALDPLVSVLSWYLGAPLSTRVGAQYALDTDYFNRMDALSYALGHDDGQGGPDLARADVVLVGVSRTSKTPTCIYLAHRGIRAANVPLVPATPLPAGLANLDGVPVVGLTVSPDRLIQLRRNRLRGLNETRESSYIDNDAVRAETVAARRLFERQGWPVIDVTRRSVEETAAAVINIISGGRGQVEVLGVIILASASAVRARLLEGACVPFRVISTGLDETAAKANLLAGGAGPREVGVHLAAAKSLAVAAAPEDLVIGVDQTLDLGGQLMDKIASVAEARERLQMLSGRRHVLHCAVAIARAGEVIWSAVSSPVMSVRPLGDAYLDGYLARAGEGLLSSVGCYELEGPGAQLFERIDGDYFAVLGLPLIELLSALRSFGALAA